ncbi:Zinc resistance conferring protein [Paramarasmius palmivorus]|uniref:Zinc resistance conferring protein n=1 Tax=Paramarasmius palmivorus TaxID=297713 RepID=A0AAW0DPP8_9AGAR
MGLSRATRIKLLLAIDIIFFFIELIVGYAVGSLALVADSFHMLNDVMSLVVALYAIKLSAENSSDSKYSYGWHRAEILAALINGVFLLALCFSIFLEAMQRFFSTPEVGNPRLVVIVGSWGLLSNIIGLFLFHEHGHSHSHSHSPPSPVLPTPPGTPEPTSGSRTPTQKSIEIRRSRARSRSPSAAFSPLYGHPAATRAALVHTAEEMAARSPSPPPRRHSRHPSHVTEHEANNAIDSSSHSRMHSHNELATERTPLIHRDDEPAGTGSTHDDHSPLSLSRNVGVIATGLVIWLTSWSFKYYFDPIISLVITVIIFASALPLVRSTSFILLQGVPPHVSLDDVRNAILDVEGVMSVHELHIWQLSETKTVASVHVLASRSHDFMPVAVQIRNVLHHHGIHSSTIQPEYPGHGVGLKTSEEGSCLIVCPQDKICNPQEHACCHGTVIFLIENVLYKVHRYFFQRDSPVFDTMFSLPSPVGQIPEGEVEDNPILLEGVETRDFDRLLSLLYPFDFVGCELKSMEEWISVLSLSTRWDFNTLRDLSITRLTPMVQDPAEQIVLGHQYDVVDWLVPAYTALCERREPLTLEEGRKLGVDLVVMIGQVRDKIRYVSNLNRDHDTIVKFVQHVFKL